MGRSPDRPYPRPRPRPWLIGHWEMWQLRGPVVAVVLLVCGAATLLFVAQAVALRPTAHDVLLTGALMLLGLVHTEIASKVERMRRRVSDTSYYDLSSVWTFAAALLLPPPLAAVVVVALYSHLWVRVWRPAKSQLYRNVYTAAAVVLAAQSAHAVVTSSGGAPRWADGPGGLTVLVTAVLIYALVNNVLVVGVIALQEPQTPDCPRRVRDLLGKVDDIALEIATLSLGALTAVAVVLNGWLILLVLVPLVVLHRADMARQLEQRAAMDGKTGLLNAAAWHDRAERALQRAQRQGVAAGLLILDLDHFKAVNDNYGHLAGDEVLSAVAATLRAEVREGDVVGRFGGEEFVVLLRDLELTSAGRRQLATVAERIRERVAQLAVAVHTPDGPLTIEGLSTSVGAVFDLGRTCTLQQVLGAADAALYAAKRDGRNVVRFGPPGEPSHAFPGTSPA
jgi:diguanylate cyclase (GGDEF)-like protein